MVCSVYNPGYRAINWCIMIVRLSVVMSMIKTMSKILDIMNYTVYSDLSLYHHTYT